MLLNHFIPAPTPHNPAHADVRTPPAQPPQSQTTWESLARASNFRATLLAHRCGVSLRTLERHFIKHYQITVSECLRKMRLNLAYTRLKSGERIKCVAYDLGYKQLSHFSRDFKNFFGVSPRTIQPAFPPLLQSRWPALTTPERSTN